MVKYVALGPSAAGRTLVLTHFLIVTGSIHRYTPISLAPQSTLGSLVVGGL